jgi:hypothetical protein
MQTWDCHTYKRETPYNPLQIIRAKGLAVPPFSAKKERTAESRAFWGPRRQSLLVETFTKKRKSENRPTANIIYKHP